MAFLDTWKKAKKTYEDNTGRSKPPANVKGAFGKSSGLESAVKGLDAALAKPTAEGILKAETTYQKAMIAYMQVLDKAIQDEKGLGFDSLRVTFKRELKALSNTLEKIASDFSAAKREALATVPQKFETVVPSDIRDGLTKSTFPTLPGVKFFATDPRVGLSGLDNKTKLPGAVNGQQIAKQALKNYLTAMKAMASLKGKVMERKAAWKAAYNVYTDAGSAVGPMEGYKNALATWVSAQESAFKAAKRFPEFRGWLDNGPISKFIKMVGDETTNEQARLNRFETFCDKHR